MKKIFIFSAIMIFSGIASLTCTEAADVQSETVVGNELKSLDTLIKETIISTEDFQSKIETANQEVKTLRALYEKAVQARKNAEQTLKDAQEGAAALKSQRNEATTFLKHLNKSNEKENVVVDEHKTLQKENQDKLERTKQQAENTKKARAEKENKHKSAEENFIVQQIMEGGTDAAHDSSIADSNKRISNAAKRQKQLQSLFEQIKQLKSKDAKVINDKKVFDEALANFKKTVEELKGKGGMSSTDIKTRINEYKEIIKNYRATFDRVNQAFNNLNLDAASEAKAERIAESEAEDIKN